MDLPQHEDPSQPDIDDAVCNAQRIAQYIAADFAQREQRRAFIACRKKFTGNLLPKDHLAEEQPSWERRSRSRSCSRSRSRSRSGRSASRSPVLSEHRARSSSFSLSPSRSCSKLAQSPSRSSYSPTSPQYSPTSSLAAPRDVRASGVHLAPAALELPQSPIETPMAPRAADLPSSPDAYGELLHGPSGPSCSLLSPKYSPTSPVYPRAPPQYSPASSPKYSPYSPCLPMSPRYLPSSPRYSPMSRRSPLYSPTSPTYSPTSPARMGSPVPAGPECSRSPDNYNVRRHVWTHSPSAERSGRSFSPPARRSSLVSPR